jgi:ParB family chromosome partitioning protein
MISVTRRIPSAVVDLIGPAPGAGRDRWTELAPRFEEDSKEAACSALLDSKIFQEADSDTRFGHVFDLFLSRGAAPEKAGSGEQTAPRREILAWGPSAENGTVVSLTHNTRVTTLSIDRRVAPGFGEFLLSRMHSLFAEYSAGKRGGEE